MKDTVKFNFDRHDALIIVDVQNDFLPGGSLAVADGHQIIEPLNKIIAMFRDHNLPIFVTRDWHPKNHCSFVEQNGPWPPHCVQNTRGAEIAKDLKLPISIHLISKATAPDKDAYSGFEGTNLHNQLKALNITRLFVGGLATDYCVLSTVLDALKLDYSVYLLTNAIKGVHAGANDVQKAMNVMHEKGAIFIEG